MSGSRSSPAWAYALTFALVASTVSSLAVVAATGLTAAILGDDAGLAVLLASPLSLAFSWAYGLIPAGLAGAVAAIARRGGSRRRFVLVCGLAGAASSALACLPWAPSVEAAAIGAAYGALGAVAASLTTRGLVRRAAASG